MDDLEPQWGDCNIEVDGGPLQAQGLSCDACGKSYHDKKHVWMDGYWPTACVCANEICMQGGFERVKQEIAAHGQFAARKNGLRSPDDKQQLRGCVEVDGVGAE